MKKILVIITSALILLVGCSSIMKCEFCKEEKMCKKYKVTTSEGETSKVYLCEDCKELLSDLAETIGVTIR